MRAISCSTPTARCSTCTRPPSGTRRRIGPRGCSCRRPGARSTSSTRGCIRSAGRPATFWSLAQRSLDYCRRLGRRPIPADLSGQAAGGLSHDGGLSGGARGAGGAEGASGATLAILSNGDPDMLEDAVRAARLEGLFDDVLSVTAAGVFKPCPAVYRLATERFGCKPRGHLVPVLEPVGHRRRQGVRLPLRVDQPHGSAGRISRPAAGSRRARPARASGRRLIENAPISSR